MTKNMEAKISMVEKKHQLKEAKWEALRQAMERKIKARFVANNAKIEVKKVKADGRAEDSQIMMMDPNGMDAFARESRKMQRTEIMQRRRQ